MSFRVNHRSDIFMSFWSRARLNLLTLKVWVEFYNLQKANWMKIIISSSRTHGSEKEARTENQPIRPLSGLFMIRRLGSTEGKTRKVLCIEIEDYRELRTQQQQQWTHCNVEGRRNLMANTNVNKRILNCFTFLYQISGKFSTWNTWEMWHERMMPRKRAAAADDCHCTSWNW